MATIANYTAFAKSVIYTKPTSFRCSISDGGTGSSCGFRLLWSQQPPPAQSASFASSPTREERLVRLQRAEQLKGLLQHWLSGSRFGSGIDVDDQKLTVFCPKNEREAVFESLTTEVKTVLGESYHVFQDSFKVKPYRKFLIRRQHGRIGSGSHIYHLDHHGKPVYVTLGAMFIDLIGKELYCLTTSHLEDAKSKYFYFSTETSFTKLGKCVACVQQDNPLLEACLIKIDKAAYASCSPGLLPELLQSPVAFRGPYTGPISELLAAPQEVMLCGGQTDLTRGRMKYYAFDFPDPDTNNKVYGGIVTLPLHAGDFVKEGDSGATVSIAAAQSFLVKDWCLGAHAAYPGRPVIRNIRRDALPVTSGAESDRPSVDEAALDQTCPKTLCRTGDPAQTAEAALDQTCPKTLCRTGDPAQTAEAALDQTCPKTLCRTGDPAQTAEAALDQTCPKTLCRTGDPAQTAEAALDQTCPKTLCRTGDPAQTAEAALDQTCPKTLCRTGDPAQTAEAALDQTCPKTLCRTGDPAQTAEAALDQTCPKTLCRTGDPAMTIRDNLVKIKVIPDDCADKTTVSIEGSSQPSVTSSANQNTEQNRTCLKEVPQGSAPMNPSGARVRIRQHTFPNTVSVSVNLPPVTPTEVMTHEAISTHCFSGRIEYEDKPPEYGSISFRMDLAVEKLQEQIGAELRLVPILLK